MSRNSSETSLRIFNSISHYGLDISRAALTGGAPLAPYLKAFQVGLFLSFDEQDVQAAVNCGIAAAKLYQSAQKADEYEQIRIAFDGDAVLFSDESERIYQEHGLEALSDMSAKRQISRLLKGHLLSYSKHLPAYNAKAQEIISPHRHFAQHW
jgi:5'-nucleotidase